MRSTVRIQDELMDELRARAGREHVSLTRVLNEVLRAGLKAGDGAGRRRRRYREETFALGPPRMDVTKALSLAAALEDDEILRKALLRK